MDLKNIAIRFAKKRFLYLQQIDSDFLLETHHLDFDDHNFWKHEIVQGLPEFSVALIAENFFGFQNHNKYSDQEIFSQIANQRNQSIHQISTYSTPTDIVDFIVKQLRVEFSNDFNSDFRIGENGFTVNHIREIVYEVESKFNKSNDGRSEFKKAFNLSSDDLEKTNRNTQRKKAVKSYAKLWLFAIILGGVFIISGLTGSFLVVIISCLVTVAILANIPFFDDMDG